MKSLLSDLRSCYRAGASKQRPASSTAEARADHALPMRRLRTTKSDKQWRPALNAISEDGVATVDESSKSCKGGSTKTVAKSRSIASFDPVELPVLIPTAIWATPFMF
ncbi:hypothetical protein ACLB2K_054535 [Fragaria x ananassa]